MLQLALKFGAKPILDLCGLDPWMMADRDDVGAPDTVTRVRQTELPPRLLPVLYFAIAHGAVLVT